jgi:hypothetical protein
MRMVVVVMMVLSETRRAWRMRSEGLEHVGSGWGAGGAR